MFNYHSQIALCKSQILVLKKCFHSISFLIGNSSDLLDYYFLININLKRNLNVSCKPQVKYRCYSSRACTLCLILFWQPNTYSKWLECASYMSLSAAISRLFFKVITFDQASGGISLFFHWKAESFNLMKHQILMSAAFSCFQ